MAETTDADYVFKTKYAKGINSLLTEQDKLQKMFAFSTGEKVGNKFVQAVDLEYEHGFTLAGNQRAPTLDAAISSEGDQAEITPSQIIGRKKIGYRDLFRSAGSGEGDDKAFSDMSLKMFRDLAIGARRNIEISLLHGQSPNGIGVVADTVVGQDIVISDATWAPGLWMGARNSVIDVFKVTDLSDDRQSGLVVGDIDEETHTVTVTGTTTGIVAGDVIYRNSANDAGSYQEAMGLAAILREDSDLYGIDPSDHPLWKPCVLENVGTPTMGKILRLASKCHIKGLNGRAVCLVPTRMFEVLNEQISGARDFDSSYKPNKALNGVESIEYRYQGGKLDIVPHSMMMEGEFFIIPVKDEMPVEDRPVKRIGSVDLTFELPDSGGKIFLHTTDVAAKEIRNYTDQGLFVNMPGQCGIGTGVTYPSA